MNISLSERIAFSRLGEKLLSQITRPQLALSMQAAEQWMGEATRASGGGGRCYRSATLLEEGGVQWSHPNSNTSEVIIAWLELARWQDAQGAALCHQRAREYGMRLVTDPEKGFYRGAQREAWGMAWYWTDDGTYTGGYSMRAPSALLACGAISGGGEARRLEEACCEIGETFLSRQLANGFVNMVGWCPKRGWLSERMAGSRYAYCIATFATLRLLTGDARYEEAYEKALGALITMQQPDGSFYQHYDPLTLTPLDGSIKVHFFSYLLNALAEAYDVTSDARLLAPARKLGAYIAQIFGARHQLPYCVDAILLADTRGADSAVQDCANGLFWLYEATGEPLWRDIALALWHEAWLHQPICPELPGWHGAIPVGNRRCDLWFITNYILATTRLHRLLS